MEDKTKIIKLINVVVIAVRITGQMWSGCDRRKDHKFVSVGDQEMR